MSRRKLIWHLYPAYLLVTIVALVAAGWYCSHYFRRFYLDQTAQRLLAQARLTAEHVAGAAGRADRPAAEELCDRLAAAGGTRITVILGDGTVLADSHEDVSIMDDHGNRPEFIQAVRGGVGRSLRFSSTLGKNMMYVAVPLEAPGMPPAVVRTSIAVTSIERALRALLVKMLAGGAVIAACAAVLGLFIAHRIALPVTRMKDTAGRFAEGQLDLRVPTEGPEEIRALAESLNEMARQLSERIDTVTSQRNELGAVLSSMAEGVLAVDAGGRIVSLNKAAAKLLNVDRAGAAGRGIEELIRSPDIQEFVSATINGEGPAEKSIFLPGNGGRFLDLHGTGVTDEAGGKIAAVIVLADVTRIRRLENVRRDFVANVSHELKTPVTSIKGFVETLLEGAMKEPDRARRFLEIIARHSDRLNGIIEDLLSLCRLEEDADKRRIDLKKTHLEPVLTAAVELSKNKSDEKGVAVELQCPADIDGRINGPLFEQAVLNLLDNAVKYSEPGQTVRVTAERAEGQVKIAVSDSGCGIEAKHLRRIFERFYVVDKGRSRKLGGTGLGLAIVKHIAQVHGGNVTVESSPGSGSTFTIHLPAGLRPAEQVSR
jgi:two-component system phosphate regulon sensor histidine kinase PhoR